MAYNVQWEDPLPHAAGIAEVPFPVFAAPWGMGKIVVRVRLLRGTLRRGPAHLRAPNGRIRPVTLLSTRSLDGQPPPFDPGELELLLEGVTTRDISAGQ